MRVIRAPSLGRAHELVVKMILEKGYVVETEDDEATVEFEETAITVENPLAEPTASGRSRFGRRFLDSYADALLHGSDAVFEYDYHSRLCDWGQGLTLEGGEVHADQIGYIIGKLKDAPESRRAVAVTWNPPVDECLHDCPCLQLIQCVVRDGKLLMKVVFRSNDMLSAAGANMFALAHLQKTIADALGLPCGAYTHISLVPHIYFVRDSNDIPPFCQDGAEISPIPEVCRACGKCPRSRLP